MARRRRKKFGLSENNNPDIEKKSNIIELEINENGVTQINSENCSAKFPTMSLIDWNNMMRLQNR